jgi:hypothetical protein
VELHGARTGLQAARTRLQVGCRLRTGSIALSEVRYSSLPARAVEERVYRGVPMSIRCAASSAVTMLCTWLGLGPGLVSMVRVYGSGAWFGCMVRVYGSGASFGCMVRVHGSGLWFGLE